jgi:hypothetical protein
VPAHEIQHNNYLHHAAFGTDEYGDRSCIMWVCGGWNATLDRSIVLSSIRLTLDRLYLGGGLPAAAPASCGSRGGRGVFGAAGAAGRACIFHFRYSFQYASTSSTTFARVPSWAEPDLATARRDHARRGYAGLGMKCPNAPHMWQLDWARPIADFNISTSGCSSLISSL